MVLLLRSFITEDTFVSADPTDRVALLHAALPKAIKVCPNRCMHFDYS